MAVKTPDTREEQDSAYSPENLDDTEQAVGSYASAGADQAEAFANDPENASDSNTKNIDDALDQESNPMNFSGSGTPEKGGDVRFLGTRKKSASLFITLGLLGGGFGFSFLGAPGLLLVHMKNIFLNDLSDATPALNIRSDRMLHNMVKDKVSVRAGFCTNGLSVRCKFSTMSNRMEKKFKKAGFTFNDNDTKRFGRRVISEIKFTAKDGTTHVLKTPQDMKNFSRTPEGRSALYKAFNPKTAAFLNSKFSKMLSTKFSRTKQSMLEGRDKKAVQESFDRSTGADRAPPASEGGRFKDAIDGSKKLSGMTGGLLIVNALAVACPLYTTAHAIAYGIKLAKMAAYFQFAYTFMNETDKLVAGNADPEVISNLGDQLTSLSSNKTINDSNDGGKEIDNPDYGKAATDSQGYRLSAYGDTGASNASTSRFSLGLPKAGIMGTIATFLTLPDKVPGGKSGFKAFCKFMGNLAVGTLTILAACFLAGGGVVCTIVNAAIGVAVGAALSQGIEKLVDYLIKQYGPMRMDSETKGTDVGNGYAVGSGVLFGGMAQANGMMPSKKEDLKQYFAYTDDIRKDTIAAETYDAQSEPFNVYNQYSFAGAIAQPLNASILSQSSFAGKFSSILGTVASSFSTLGRVGAAYNMPAHPYTDKRYSMCDDIFLKNANVDPDALCTVRYSMSPAELEMDTDDNAVYMTTQPSVDYPYVDPKTGEPNPEAKVSPEGPIDDNYLKFVEFCGIDRKDMIGSTLEPFDDDAWHTGKACSDKSEMMSNFRVYTMNDNISTSMEEEPGADAIENTTGAGLQLRAASFNIFHSDKQSDAVWKARLALSVGVLKNNQIDIAGLQESRKNQQEALKTTEFGADVYDIYPKDSNMPAFNPNPIVWNKEKYELVKASEIPIKYEGGRAAAIVLRMKDIATQTEFYFINTHDPADSRGTAQDRFDNANTYVTELKKLKQDGLPVIFSGDFNSMYSLRPGGNQPLGGLAKNLTYCILTRDGSLWDASDAIQNKSGECPSQSASDKPDSPNRVDHIFISNSLSVTKFFSSPSGLKNNGSDAHDTVIADVFMPGSGDGGGSSFNISSFNICYGIAAGGSGYATCADGQDFRPRLERSVSVIKGNDVDVAGLQEVRGPNTPRGDQFNGIKTMLGDSYDIYPDPYKGYGGQNPIIWRKDKFTLVSKKQIAGYSVTTGPNSTANTQVKLRDNTTGQTFYVINEHEPVGNTTKDQRWRTESATNRANYVKNLASENIPVFITGDFNSKYQASGPGVGQDALGGIRANLSYCILTDGTGLWDAWDASKNQTGKCPSTEAAGRGPGPVDHIYMNSDIKVSSYKYFGGGVNSNGSDHNTLIANVTIPGSVDSGGDSGPAWPVDKKYWEANKADFLDAHPMSSGTFTSPYAKGIASDISTPPDGSPIYSMLAGQVTREDDCAIIVQSKVSGGLLLVAYGHSTSHKVSKGDSLTSGQQIAGVGSTCNSTGGHLHVDMAYNGKHICPQDVFIAMGNNRSVDFGALTKKGVAPCGRI